MANLMFLVAESGCLMKTFIEIKTPQAYDYLQTIRHCQIMFELSNLEVQEITQKLLDRSMIAPNEMHYVVAKEGDQPIGFAVYYYLEKIQLGYLDYMGILTEHQGGGAGSALYEEMLEDILVKHPKVEGLILEVKGDDSFQDRQRFFLNRGAKAVDLSQQNLPQKVKESGMVLMHHSLSKDSVPDSETINGAFKELAKTLWH